MVRLAKMRGVYPNGPPPSICGRQPADGKSRGLSSKIGPEHEEAIRTANADDIDTIDLAGIPDHPEMDIVMP